MVRAVAGCAKMGRAHRGDAMTIDDDARDGLTDLALILSEDAAVDPAASVDTVARRRRRRAWGIGVAVFFLLAFGAIGGYVWWALNAPLRPPVLAVAPPPVPTAPAAAVAVSGASSAVSVTGGDEYLGAAGLQLPASSEEPRPIASISKLVTALVILDAHPLAGADDPGPTITFTKADHDLYDRYYVLGATIAAMPTGSSLSLHDALATMLIPSASNYADALSTWAFGSQRAFVAAARDWLDAHQLTGTTIVEPTGIDDRNTSTPTDLLALARLAAAEPTVAAIAATPSVTLPGPGTLYNTNGLLGTEGITGLKTGNLGEGTYGLLYTAALDVGAGAPLSVVGVQLDAFTRDESNAQVLRLLRSIREGFHDVPLVETGLDLGGYTTPWGSSARIVVARGASLYTWSDTPITVTLASLTPATYRDGEVVGTLTWTAGPNTATADLVLSGDIDPPTDWWRLTHPGELGD
jgi:serine-type D-Ala-D-Ala carboxypeptidase (penicillin-binding protein 5/6)